MQDVKPVHTLYCPYQCLDEGEGLVKVDGLLGGEAVEQGAE